MKLQGKAAVITRGAQGIGIGCAIELAREGAEIALVDRPGYKNCPRPLRLSS